MEQGLLFEDQYREDSFKAFKIKKNLIWEKINSIFEIF